MSGQKLLIVEDCEPVSHLLQAALVDHFPEVHAVPSLAAARRHLRLEEDPSVGLVICGQTLSDGTGEDFKLWLDTRRPPGAGRTPFVLIAGSQPGLRRAGAGYIILSKPFLVEDLLQAIREARLLAGGSAVVD